MAHIFRLLFYREKCLDESVYDFPLNEDFMIVSEVLAWGVSALKNFPEWKSVLFF